MSGFIADFSMGQNNSLNSVLIIGAQGVLGRSLSYALTDLGYKTVGLARVVRLRQHKLAMKSVGDFKSVKNWSDLIQDVDTVILCADRPRVPLLWHFLPIFLVDMISRHQTKYYDFIAQICISRDIPLILMSSRMVSSSQDRSDPVAASPSTKYGRIKKMQECQLGNHFNGKDGGRLVVFRLPLVLEPGSKSMLKYFKFLSSFGIQISKFFEIKETIPYVTATSLSEHIKVILNERQDVGVNTCVSVISNTFGIDDIDFVLHNGSEDKNILQNFLLYIFKFKIFSYCLRSYLRARSIDFPHRNKKKARMDLQVFFKL